MKQYYYIFFLLFILISGCNSSDKDINDTEDVLAVTESHFSVNIRSRDDSNNSVNILEDDFIPEISQLFISQMGTMINPSFNSSETTNLYQYTYYNNSDASWNAGTNFKPNKDKAVNWNDIKNRGLVGNVYSLYAMYFPYGNSIISDGNNGFSVQTDQSTLDNLRKSNILGAYHATSSLFTPLKFRLFHLTVYLQVNVFLPAFDPNDNTGFKENALQDAFVLNVNPNYIIEWRALRASDIEAPLVVLNNSEDTSNIRMYSHIAPGNSPDRAKLKMNEFYGDLDMEMEEDDVYVLPFSVLIPPQGTNFSDNDFLKFSFATPGGSVKNYYYAAKTQQVGGSFGMTQGVLQVLNLYIPRNGDGIILVSAEVLPWTPADTNMNVTKKESNE